MTGMISVRFPAGVISAVRRLARQDGVTVSQWIRRRVDDEIRHGQERRGVADVSAYPRTETVTSGRMVKVIINGAAVPQSWTGYYRP